MTERIIKRSKQLGFSCKLSFGEMFRFSKLESTEVMHEIAIPWCMDDDFYIIELFIIQYFFFDLFTLSSCLNSELSIFFVLINIDPKLNFFFVGQNFDFRFVEHTIKQSTGRMAGILLFVVAVVLSELNKQRVASFLFQKKKTQFFRTFQKQTDKKNYSNLFHSQLANILIFDMHETRGIVPNYLSLFSRFRENLPFIKLVFHTQE